MSRRDYVRRETIVSMAINSTFSLLFFLLAFGGRDPVPMWGMRQWVFDFIPQSFMIALMGTLVPGALAARAVKAGRVAADGPPSRLPRPLVVRALLLAVLAASLGTPLVAAMVALAGLTALPNLAALLVKVAYGAALAAVITPLGLRRVLARR